MEKLGINAIGLAAQVVNVLILLVVLKKFMYKPLIGVLEKRKQLAAEQVETQAELSKKIKDLEAKERELVRQNKIKADELVKKAEAKMKKEHDAVMKEAKSKAAKQAEQIVADAESKVSRMNRDFDRHVTTEAAKLANQALKLLVGTDGHKQIIETQIAKLSKN